MTFSITTFMIMTLKRQQTYIWLKYGAPFSRMTLNMTFTIMAPIGMPFSTKERTAEQIATPNITNSR